MKNLIPFTPQGCDKPVALVSPNCPDFIKDVITNSWDKSSSGLGSHIYVDSQSITDPDELQEYWEEYSLQLDAESRRLTLSLLLTESSYLLIMSRDYRSSRLTDALNERFDDLDEIKDVAKHGCDAGVSGFIYYNETRKFFFEHEDEIEEQMDWIYCGDNYINELTDRDNCTVNQLINKIVWVIVENYCKDRVNQAEESAAA